MPRQNIDADATGGRQRFERITGSKTRIDARVPNLMRFFETMTPQQKKFLAFLGINTPQGGGWGSVREVSVAAAPRFAVGKDKSTGAPKWADPFSPGRSFSRRTYLDPEYFPGRPHTSDDWSESHTFSVSLKNFARLHLAATGTTGQLHCRAATP
jgi:hypothetical protein